MWIFSFILGLREINGCNRSRGSAVCWAVEPKPSDSKRLAIFLQLICSMSPAYVIRINPHRTRAEEDAELAWG